MRSFCLAIAFALLSLPLHAAAEECTPTTTEAEIDTGDTVPGHRLYVKGCTVIGCRTPDVYEESNGIDGLQRGDEMFDDTCGGLIAPDSYVAGNQSP